MATGRAVPAPARILINALRFDVVENIEWNCLSKVFPGQVGFNIRLVWVAESPSRPKTRSSEPVNLPMNRRLIFGGRSSGDAGAQTDGFCSSSKGAKLA
jgi:hypothetical protein